MHVFVQKPYIYYFSIHLKFYLKCKGEGYLRNLKDVLNLGILPTRC
jgi:hypothetical protein